MVAFPAILIQNKVDAAHVGVAFACDVIGGISMLLLLTRVVGKFGIMSTIRLAAMLYCVAILVIYFYCGFLWWISLVFLMGLCWVCYVITRQSWLNMLLTDEKRGMVLGLFSMLISAGVALGPLIVKEFGALNYRSFVASAILVLLSLLCVEQLRHLPQPQIKAERIPLKTFFKNNPRCFLARFVLDFCGYCLSYFTVIFGSLIGLSYEKSGLLVTAYMASGFVDVIVGALLNRLSPYRFIKIGFLICIASFLLVAFCYKSYILLFICYFCFGAGVACIFVSVYKIANEDYGKNELVAANATFQLIGSLGSLCACLIGGLLIQIFGLYGFPITIVGCCILYLYFLVYYEKSKVGS